MGRYINDRIKTDNEWDGFDRISLNDRINAMCSYLLISNQNMEKVAVALYKNEKYSQTVSLIHRGYNLKDRNGGKYAPSSKFCRTYGEVLQEDIEAFVYKYPQGIRTTDNPGSGIELEEFLKERTSQRNSYANNADNGFYTENNNMSYHNARSTNSSNTFNISQYSDRQTDSSYSNRSSNFDLDDFPIGLILGIGSILFIVLALVFNWFSWRSKLLVLISDWIQVVWLVGMLIFLLRTIMGRVDFMYEKKFSAKVVTFLAIGFITYILVSLFGYLCYYLSMK